MITITTSTDEILDHLVDDFEVGNPMQLKSHRDLRRDALANPPDPIIQGMFSRGQLVVFAGESGTGKTWVMLDMATAVATGQEWLNHKTTPCRVAFIDGEMGDYDWHSRHVKIENGRNLAGVNYNIMVNHLPEIDILENPKYLTDLINTNQIELLIIDALSSTHSGNENDTKDMTAVMKAFLNAAKKTNCAIIVIHHTAKNGGYRGSSTIRNKCDVLFMLTQTKQIDERVKLTNKLSDGGKARNYAGITLYAHHNWDNNAYTLTCADAIENSATKPLSKRDKAIQAVCEYIRGNNLCRFKDIVENCAESTKLPKTTIKDGIKQAKNRGFIVGEDGIYSIKMGDKDKG